MQRDCLGPVGTVNQRCLLLEHDTFHLMPVALITRLPAGLQVCMTRRVCPSPIPNPCFSAAMQLLYRFHILQVRWVKL